MAARISDKERAKRYKSLGLTPEEEQELIAYDKAIEDEEETEFDLTEEQLQVEKKMRSTGTRQTSKSSTPRQRQPNATKGGIIAEIAEFLEKNSQFSISNLQVTNKERQIAFAVGADFFELTLVQKRKKK